MELRVAIFEDNKLVRDALEAILNGTPGFTCCGAFSDGNNWRQDISRARPDVVLMDIEMPGIDGLTLTRHINENWPDIRILIQTVFNDSSKIFNALCAGASGYILKNDTPARFLEAIREICEGGATINPSVAKKILGFFNNKNVILVEPQSHDFNLTAREREILKMVVEGHNHLNIAALISISHETVRTHVKNIYKKLHVTSRSEAIMKARQQGLV